METAKDRIYRGKEVVPDRELVMRMLNCPEGEDGDRIRASYERIRPIICRAIRPSALFTLDQMPEGEFANPELRTGQEVLSVVLTLGTQVSRMITQLFEQDSLNGLVADVIANGCLFAFEEQVFAPLSEYCKKHRIGICGRYEAPLDFSLECQNLLFERSKAEELLYLNMNDCYMIEPEKSAMIVFGMTDDEDHFEVAHDCTRCTATNCNIRKIYT